MFPNLKWKPPIKYRFRDPSPGDSDFGGSGLRNYFYREVCYKENLGSWDLGEIAVNQRGVKNPSIAHASKEKIEAQLIRCMYNFHQLPISTLQINTKNIYIISKYPVHLSRYLQQIGVSGWKVDRLNCNYADKCLTLNF